MIGAGKQVLNVGAGGDTQPIRSLHACNIEVVSSDYAESTVSELKRRIEHPVFACDLIHINELLPENSFDYIIGNSVLAYVELRKIPTVVSNIVNIMKTGGIFTFDMTPHPDIYSVISKRSEATILNESSPDPADLLDLFAEFGVQDGLNLFPYFNHIRSLSGQIAFLHLLKETFESYGCSVQLTRSTLDDDGPLLIIYIMQVSLNNNPVQPILDGSTPVSLNSSTVWQEDKLRPSHPIEYIDRHWASKLNKAMSTTLSIPELFLHIAHSQDSSLAKEEHIQNLSQKFSPSLIVEELRPYLEGRRVMPLRKPSSGRLFEQAAWRSFFHERPPFGSLSEEQMISVIEGKYEEERRNKLYVERQSIEEKRRKMRASKRKQQKKARKKSRRR